MTHPNMKLTAEQQAELAEIVGRRVPLTVQIRELLNMMGRVGKTSERAINTARNAAEWLAAGGFSKYSNHDFDISNSLHQSLQFDA